MGTATDAVRPWEVAVGRWRSAPGPIRQAGRVGRVARQRMNSFLHLEDSRNRGLQIAGRNGARCVPTGLVYDLNQ